MRLAADFIEHGPIDENIRSYAKLDKEIIELTKCAAKKAGRKKFGYMRSPDLVHAGQLLMLHKCLLSCKLCCQLLPESCINLATRLGIDVSSYDMQTCKQLRQEVYKKRQDLWAVQKECKDRRAQWLQMLAKDRTRAAGDADWEKKMKSMKRTVEERQINRKLSAVTKGAHSQLDRIQIPTNTWYHSAKETELYHYDNGVWEAYPHLKPYDNRYFTHHTLKVVPPDAVPVEVRKTNEYIEIASFVDTTEPMWRDVTNPVEIKRLLLARNKRHLQQADIEGGTSSTPIMRLVQSEHGLSSFNDQILQGKPTTTLETTPELIDWFEAVKRPTTPTVKTVVGIIDKESYQEMFKNATEKHHQEKAGVRNIHLLRIIGLLEADFNTALKYFFAKKMMTNAEHIGISDEQWGSRKHRSSVDAAMLKLLMFETARVKRATLAGTYYDLVANYDRIFKSISNLFAQRCGMDKNILRARALVIENMRRRVKTALGTSTESYGQEPNEPKVGGEVQGKGDVPSLWCVQSNTLLRAHKKGAHGMMLQNPDGSRQIKRCNTQFVDDDDSWALAPFDSEFPTSETGLGYYLCLDGNQQHQYKYVYDAIADICNKITGAQLSEKETRQALLQRLLPKLDYGLYASYFNKRQCTNIDKVINASFLPRLRINRKTSRAVIYGPRAYGGLEMPDVYTRQTQHHIKYMIKQLRWDSTLTNDILTALDNIQLASGFISPILEKTDSPMDYINKGWIVDLRERLNKIGVQLWIEDAWQPKPQREGDFSLMERFLSVTTTAKQRDQLRKVLHWLRVITIADLADPTGQFIPGYCLSDWVFHGQSRSF
ncbi:hypothetical protein ACHAWO_002060 [Cyclotella atomus]|uniref:Uncharacterized protein n=1 Tax=Cyclotella atomus TaxID=382360 RepID=A0ABD3Q9W1_9STRA